MKKTSNLFCKFLFVGLLFLLACSLLLVGCEDYENDDDYENNNIPSSNKPSSNKPNSSKYTCGHSSCIANGPFYCMGKNDTCPNKTYCAYDLYCDSCG